MFLMLIQTFSKWAIVVEYKLNKNYIAKNLCINKVKPKLHCNGKCQMMKKLAEDEKQNSSDNNTTKIKTPETVFYNEISNPVLPYVTFIIRTYNEEPPLKKYISPVPSIFHPPARA
jgi:hypothetical protein